MASDCRAVDSSNFSKLLELPEEKRVRKGEETEKETPGGGDRCITPTAKECRIPEMLTCPPAPRKRRTGFISSARVMEYFVPPNFDAIFAVDKVSQVKTSWFMRGGLTPLCIDHVLLEMHNAGDILLNGDLMDDPTSGRLYQMFKRVVHLIGISRSSAPQVIVEDRLILRMLLQERAAEVIKLLSESHWTSNCVITMGRFQSICNGSNEASAILNYLSRCGKARYLSMGKKGFIQGVKISLVAAAVPGVLSLDYDALHLIWTMERLQQQLDVIDQRCEKSKKSALASSKSGNKQAALDHIRQLKLTSGSREKCASLLSRVEEVINAIYIAESTKKVSEAMKIGARAIKENGISVEEVELVLQEVDESVAAQKQIEEAFESVPLQSTGFEDEDVEEEFKKLEIELGDGHSQIPIVETVPGGTASGAAEETKIEESAESLSETLSNLKLETA